jgi:hypothetical protein
VRWNGSRGPTGSPLPRTGVQREFSFSGTRRSTGGWDVREAFQHAEQLVEIVMGRRPELCSDYIRKTARFARDLDV